MSTYQQKLRKARMLIIRGAREASQRLIIELLPSMLPDELIIIMHQAILSDDADLIEFCIDTFNRPQLLRNFQKHDTKLLHLAAGAATDEAIAILLNKNIYDDINARDMHKNTALMITYWNNSCPKMNLLLQKGAELYPDEGHDRYVRPNYLPSRTSKILAICIAREEAEKRVINQEDIEDLKFHFPTTYLIYEKAKLEWEKLTNTVFVKKISYRDLIESPINTYLYVTRSAEFRAKEKEDHDLEFPIYSATIRYALSRLNERRMEWEAKEEELTKITLESIPDLIIEQIAYYLCIN